MKKWVKRMIGIIVLLLAAGAGIYYYMKPVDVEIFRVEDKTMFYETEEADAYVTTKNRFSVSTELGGKIFLLVEEGQKVTKGQKLATISAEDVQFQLGQIDAQIKLQKIQIEIAQLERDEAEKAYLIVKQLYDEGGISKQEVDDAKALMEMKENYLQLQKAQLSVLTGGSGSQRGNISSKLGKTTIYSPGDGIISSLMVDDLGVVLPSSKLMDIIDDSAKIISMDFPAQSIAALQYQGPVQIKYEELGVEKILPGKVNKISKITTMKQSALGLEEPYIQVDVKPDSAIQLPIGYKAKVEVVTKKMQAMTVPTQSIFESEGKDYVFLVKENVAQKKPITKGIEIEDKTEVLQGLSVNDIIILKPNDSSIKDGTKINYE